MSPTFIPGNGVCSPDRDICAALPQGVRVADLLDGAGRSVDPWTMADLSIPARRPGRDEIRALVSDVPDSCIERRWIAWSRTLLALGVVAVLMTLGIANVAMRATRQSVEDGVLWTARLEGVTATEVA